MASVYLLPGKEKRAQLLHPWIFRSDIDRVEGPYENGDVVGVYAAKGHFLARAFYNPQSQIALRILTRQDEDVDEAFFRERICRAWQYRQAVSDPMSCRLIHAESDFLPGLIVDKFADVLVMQSLSLGIARRQELIADLLMEQVQPRAIVARNDAPVRKLEGLALEKGVIRGEAPKTVQILENGIRFRVDLLEGQKTGYFLDQKENRAAIAPFVKGKRVLDCFTHTGAFALHAAKYGAAQVLGVDISDEAVGLCRQNAALNGFENVAFQQANVFDFLRDLKGNPYDVIILDPPAFAKSRSAIAGAERGYKDINLRAIRLLPPGGILVSCSCSHHMDTQRFLDTIASAARDARRSLQMIELRFAGKDHPSLLAAPETAYLKCVIFRVW